LAHADWNFWIATDWGSLARLFIGPYILRLRAEEAKVGVDELFGALLVVVLGSMTAASG
jgi:cell division septation protein DedD